MTINFRKNIKQPTLSENTVSNLSDLWAHLNIYSAMIINKQHRDKDI